MRKLKVFTVNISFVILSFASCGDQSDLDDLKVQEVPANAESSQQVDGSGGGHNPPPGGG